MLFYHGPSPECRPHLIVEVDGVSGFVIDAPIVQTTRKVPIWHHATNEFWTPLSIPLRVSITLGAKNGLQVWSVKTKLLDVGLTDIGIDVSLLLPSDEMLHVWVDKRPHGMSAGD